MNQYRFCRLTGATARQVDSWFHAGMDLCRDNTIVGQGNQRSYKIEKVPAVQLLVQLQDKFGHGITKETLKEIFDNYELGYLALGDGVILKWRVDDRVDATPGGSSQPFGQRKNSLRGRWKR